MPPMLSSTPSSTSNPMESTSPTGRPPNQTLRQLIQPTRKHLVDPEGAHPARVSNSRPSQHLDTITPASKDQPVHIVYVSSGRVSSIFLTTKNHQVAESITTQVSCAIRRSEPRPGVLKRNLCRDVSSGHTTFTRWGSACYHTLRSPTLPSSDSHLAGGIEPCYPPVVR